MIINGARAAPFPRARRGRNGPRRGRRRGVARSRGRTTRAHLEHVEAVVRRLRERAEEALLEGGHLVAARAVAEAVDELECTTTDGPPCRPRTSPTSARRWTACRT